MMGTLGLYFKKKAGKILCFILIAAVMFSRMYLGVHTPKDELVSFAVSILCTIFIHRFFYINKRTEGKEKQISILMIIVCILLSIYAIVLYQKGTITMDYASDCVKAAGAGMAFALGFFVEKCYIRFSAPDTIKGKILRLIVGLAVTLLIQKGLKPIIGTSLLASFVRYFLIVLWVTVVYPILFTRKNK